MDEVEHFRTAVKHDMYCAIELETGDMLITDDEGDGTLHPYVEPTGDHGDKHPTDILDDVAMAVQRALDVPCRTIEYDATNDVYRPLIDKDAVVEGLK